MFFLQEMPTNPMRIALMVRPVLANDLLQRVIAVIEAAGCEVMIAQESWGGQELAASHPTVALSERCEADAVDMICCVGGDGTMLGAFRACETHEIPIVGIHAGNIGFLPSVELDDLESSLSRVLRGEYDLSQRSYLEWCVDDERQISGTCLNELVAYAGDGRMSWVDVMISPYELYEHDDGGADPEREASVTRLTCYAGDGLICATPTGSSAYNLSAGGPLLVPMLASMILTPISPHSMTHKPLVLDTQHCVVLTPRDRSISIRADGGESYQIEP